MAVNHSNTLQLVLMRGDGRAALSLRFSRAGLRTILSLGLMLSTSTGAVLGAQEHGAPELAKLAWHARLAHGVSDGLRASSFLVMPRSRPWVEPQPPPPPPVPSVQLPQEPATPEHRRGHLRVHSLHFDEDINVVPFDEEGRPNPDAFAEINRLWRCRITGHEVPVNPRLVRLITAVNDLYDKPVHLISGHRVPHTIGTSPTSQHTIGTAADIRVPGVSANELRALAKKLGARGVGLYSHKRFVHVDFRSRRKYFWTDRPEAPEVAPQVQEPAVAQEAPREAPASPQMLGEHASVVLPVVARHADRPLEVEL